MFHYCLQCLWNHQCFQNFLLRRHPQLRTHLQHRQARLRHHRQKLRVELTYRFRNKRPLIHHRWIQFVRRYRYRQHRHRQMF